MGSLKNTKIILGDGFRVGVTTGGSGIPMVFLHGLSVSSGAYTELLELLANNGFRVVALDAADHGNTDCLPWGHTVADMIEVTAAALDVLGVERAVMVGHSMGGGMLVEFAARYPERVTAAILLDAAAGEQYHDGIDLTPSYPLPLRVFKFLGGAARDIIGDAVRAGSIRRAGERLDLVNRLRSSMSGMGCLKAARALTTHDTNQALTSMKRSGVRTVVVHGTEDRIVPVEAAVSAAHLSGGNLRWISGGFHSWMIADPVTAAEVIKSATEAA